VRGAEPPVPRSSVDQHPLQLADELRSRAAAYQAAVPELREAAREALADLLAARRGAAECARWADELEAKHDQRRGQRPAGE
jgi:hypothetical protein